MTRPPDTHTHTETGQLALSTWKSLSTMLLVVTLHFIVFVFFFFLYDFSCLINVRKYVRNAVFLDVSIDDVVLDVVVVLLLIVALVVMIVAVVVVVKVWLHLWMLLFFLSLARAGCLGCVVYVKAENIMSNIIGASVGFQHKHLRERVWRILVAL